MMCFSAEASFTAAAVLTGVGVATIRTAKGKGRLLLACIPGLFAVQQFAEGVLWMTLPDITVVGTAAKYVFLTFAFLFWPTWFPFALSVAETVPWKKRVMFLALGGGLFIAAASIFYAVNNGVTASIVNCSIHYGADTPEAYKALYVPVVLVPAFISSIKKMHCFGMLGLVTFFVAEVFYQATMVSIWCFFAAVISLTLYKILKNDASQQSVR